MTVPTLAAVLATGLAAGAAWQLDARELARSRLASLQGSQAHTSRLPASRRVVSTVMSYLARARGRARQREGRRAEVTELCFALAAELRAGRMPAEAVARAVEVMTDEHAAELAGVIAASADRRRRSSRAAHRRSPPYRRRSLGRLAACWQVGSGSGAGFARAVERLAGGLRTEQEHRREVAAQLAGTRATTRLLGMLPFAGLLMATGMGMQPVDFLFGTSYGLFCLGAGVTLDVAGMLWTSRLARHAVEGE